ncbi:MAG: TldD/PmbA family protein [Bacteroidales bacterium]|nr:TldD/PmbA family protein [Bacteroidales bacterium]
MEEITGMLTESEIRMAELCLDKALELGADKARVTLNKSLMELFGILNGELDKVNHCLDRSLSVCLFVDGKYGTFSTNRLVDSELDSFLRKSVATVRMLAEDPCRDLPDPGRTVKDALSGKELGLYDPSYPSLTSDERLKMALDASIFKKHEEDGLISEEGEYSDSIFDTFVLDSNGLRCRHIETSFEYGVEMTVKDPEGNRFSGYWWDSTPRLADLKISDCGETAFQRAMAQIGPKKVPSGKYTLVVDSENSSRLVTPLTSALGAFALQQKNSFLLDTLGKKVFPEWLDLIDMPHAKGQTGSRLFDSEGVATKETPVIEKGVVKEYFVNTYMSNKMGIAPTIEDVTRPVIPPCVSPELTKPGKMDRQAIMDLVKDGILVTGFNGGNSNSATGDFSFGVEGFLFKDGRVVHPVREMLITGNLLTLWNNLLAAGDDARTCKSKVIPTLAFKNVDFSA